MFKQGKKIYKLVDQHLECVVECYNGYAKYVEMYFSGAKEEKLNEQYQKVDEIEDKADDIRREVMRALLDSSFLPQTRREIIKIVQLIDKIANKAEDTCREMFLETVTFFEEAKPKILEIISLTGKQLGLLTKALEMLFSDYNKLLQEDGVIREIKKIESAVDKIDHDLVGTIYRMKIKLAEKNHMRHFVNKFSDISDYIEDVSDEIIIVCVLRKV